MKLIKPVLLFIACIYCPGLSAQNNAPKINSYLDRIGKARQLNGNILLAENGHVIADRAFGYADFVTQKPNTTNLRFNLASISKLFTSTAILQLRDKGKLSLDDHLYKFFPGFPFKDITIRHLLTHTSGLPDGDLYDAISKKHSGAVVVNKDILPELMSWKGGLQFKPGDKFRYCNVGYNVLALLIEKVSGTSLSAYLEQYIFKPAGMKDTYLSIYGKNCFYNDARCVKMHYQPHPYYDTTYAHADSSAIFEWIKFANYTANGPVGGSNIITPTADLLRFDQAFFDGKLLKPSSMEEALTPLTLNNGETYYGRMDTMDGEGKMTVGLGWDIFIQPGIGKSVGHGGFIFGNATFYLRNLDKKQVIIAFDNTAGSEYGRIVTSAQSLMNGKAPMEIRTHRSMAFVYGSTLVKQGPDAAASALNVIKSDTTHYYLSEWEINQLGGNLLHRSAVQNHEQLAVEAFKINTLLFPDSFNTYDSYAEGLRMIGKRQEAIAMYQKSILMNPGNDDGKQALKELLDGK
ncbi:MAG: serine hydrolase domain-containing protein [Bacteroidota bacterium]